MMFQYGKWHYVRHQPQFDLHPPLHSNPPVRPDAGFIREHYLRLICEPKECPRAGIQGIVDGDPMLVVGHIIRRFVGLFMFIAGCK